MYISSTNSTNTLLRELIAAGNPPEFIYTGFQTAGRGQSGNGWESEEGKNLLCSVLLPPRENLFDLNVLVSVAVHRTITSLVFQAKPAGGTLSGEEGLTIKWPNDIYWGDKKLAGILIENAIVGNELRYSIAGIGLNVNQTVFVSNAPNPVSLRQIAGTDFDIDALMQALIAETEAAEKRSEEDLWDYYRSHLYRKEGFWPFVEREVSTAPTMNADAGAQGQFDAQIKRVLPSGEIMLLTREGTEKKYHFKQIRYVINS